MDPRRASGARSQWPIGSTDPFLRKYNEHGDVLWTCQFGTSSQDLGLSIVVLPPGVYVAGDTAGEFPGQTHLGDTDGYIRKFNTDGDTIWTRQISSPAREEARKIAADSTGLYVAGITEGALHDNEHLGSRDGYVTKYSFNGDRLWTQQLGIADFDVTQAIDASDSGVYVVGDTQGALPQQSSFGGRDSFIRKYDAFGAEVWTHQFGTIGGDHTGAVFANESGVYVGMRTDDAYSDWSNQGSSDAYIRRYD